MVLSLAPLKPCESAIYFRVCGCHSLEEQVLRFGAGIPCFRLKAELRLVRRSGFALLTCVASERRWSSKPVNAKWSIGTSPVVVERAYRELQTNGSSTSVDSRSTNVDSANVDSAIVDSSSRKGLDDNVDTDRREREDEDISARGKQEEQTVGDGTGSAKAEPGQPVAVVSSALPWNSGSSARLFTSSRFAFLFGVVIAVFGALSLTGLLFGRWWNELWERATAETESTSKHEEKQGSTAVEAPSAFSFFMKKDLRRKETVEWVNMVIGKLWKVYRRGLEIWLVGLLQPLIDNLKKPSYVRRVEIKQFNLGDEPLSVRSVERRTSRHANDLQYHIGLRYTGEARMLLSITVTAGFLPVVIPVGVRGLDVDGEVWVKLRLIPSQPWVGTATWAFVSLPKIILALAPFGLFNIMGTPFLSRFLTKLLTVDLPQLFVRPNKIVISFTKNQAKGPESRDERMNIESNEDFAGELSVTVVDARKLKFSRFAKTDPYVVLSLGDQIIRSKKNSQTTIIGPPGAPIWNQDFQMLVVDPQREKLTVRVRDTVGLTVLTIGSGEVDLSTLQDTVPTDKIVTLKGGWGPKRFAGEIMLRLTYKAYVEEEEEDDIPLSSDVDSDSDKDEFTARKHYRRRRRRETLMNNLLYAVNATVSDLGYESLSASSQESAQVKQASSTAGSAVEAPTNASAVEAPTNEAASAVAAPTNEAASPSLPPLERSRPASRAIQRLTENSAVMWLSLATGIALLAAVSLNFSNLLNP